MAVTIAMGEDEVRKWEAAVMEDGGRERGEGGGG